MRRYLSVLFVSYLLIIAVVSGSTYLTGQAGKQQAKDIKSITVYTSLPLEQIEPLAQDFEKSQEIRVNIVPLSEADLLVRVSSQKEKPQADLILANRSLLEQAKAGNLLMPYTSEQLDIIPSRFIDKDNFWTGIWYDPIVFVANQDFLKKMPQPPAKWSDLTKVNTVRVGITDFLASEASANLLYTLMSNQGEQQTLTFLKQLHPQIVQYAKFLATPVRMAGLGEVDIAIAVQSEAMRYLKDSFPLTIIHPEEGTAYLLTGAGLIKDAPQQAEAKLFINWLTQDNAQAALQRNKLYFVPTNPEIPAYKSYDTKNMKLLDNKLVNQEQQKQLLDKWVQTVRLNTKQ